MKEHVKDQDETVRIEKGTIAICSQGYLGLVLRDGRHEVTLSDGSKHMAYVGIHLEFKNGKAIGDNWSSRNPKLVGRIEDLTSICNKCVNNLDKEDESFSSSDKAIFREKAAMLALKAYGGDELLSNARHIYDFLVGNE